MNEYSHLTDEELEAQIKITRQNAHAPTSSYHDYIAEKERREKQKVLEREQENQKIGKEQFESVAVRLDKIIKLLELIGKHPWWASIIAFIFAVLSGTLANLLADSVHYILSLILHK